MLSGWKKIDGTSKTKPECNKRASPPKARWCNIVFMNLQTIVVSLKVKYLEATTHATFDK